MQATSVLLLKNSFTTSWCTQTWKHHSNMDSEAAHTIHYYPSLHGFCQAGDISMLSSSLRSVSAAVWFGGNPSVLLLFWYCETLHSAKAIFSSQLLTKLSSQRQKVLVTAVRCSHIVIQSQRRSCIHNLICAFNNVSLRCRSLLSLLFSIHDHHFANPQQVRCFFFYSFTIIFALFCFLWIANQFAHFAFWFVFCCYL